MKRTRNLGLILPAAALILTSFACEMPSREVAADLSAIATQTMQALATTVAAAQAASDASPEQGGAQNPPEEETAPAGEPSPTPTVTLTPTPAPPIVSVSVDTNCRFGPGDIYDYLGALMVGETSQVIAKNSSETFWYIRNPDPPPPFCWVWGFYASIEGDTGPLPVYTPEPTPTPSPVPFAFQADFGGAIPCGAYAFFARIKNTGGVPIESLYLTVVDTTINLTNVHVNDIFATSVDCTPSITPRINPGEVGFTFVSGFQTIANHTFEATVKVCTQDGMGGECASDSFTVP